jgi:hypothetical protein
MTALSLVTCGAQGTEPRPTPTQFMVPSGTMCEKDFFISNTVGGTYLANGSRSQRSGTS